MIDQIEGLLKKIYSLVPYNDISLSITAFFHPEEVLAKNAKKLSLSNAAKILAVAGLIYAVAFAINYIANTVVSGVFGTVLGGANGAVSGAVNIVGAVIFAAILLVLIPIFAVIGEFILSAIYFVFAKLLGGKGTYAAQTNMLAYITSTFYLISAPATIIQIVPCLGAVVGGIIIFAGSIYQLYASYKTIKAVHQLSGIKAGLVIILPIILVVILAIIAVVLLGAVFLTTAMAALASGGAGNF